VYHFFYLNEMTRSSPTLFEKKNDLQAMEGAMEILGSIQMQNIPMAGN
jgi:hypothetical protein